LRLNPRPGPGPVNRTVSSESSGAGRPAAPCHAAKPRPPAGPSVAAAKYRLSRRALSRRRGQETAQYRQSRRALPESLPVTTFPRHGATGPEMARLRAAQAANLSLTCSPPRAARQGHHNATIPESRCHGSTEALKTRCDTPPGSVWQQLWHRDSKFRSKLSV